MFLKSKLPNLQQNIFLANHTTFRIGGPAKYFLVAREQKELVAAIRWAKENNLLFYILGGGSNLLVNDKGYEGLIIKVQSDSSSVILRGEAAKDLKRDKIKITVEAGVSFNKVIINTVKNNFSGVEWGFGIPGTIGGAIFGNAGRLGRDISPVVKSVKTLDENLNEKIIPAEECGFAYRESRFKKTGEIILEAELEFAKKEKKAIEPIFSAAKEVFANSPKFPSAGCIFKNYIVGVADTLLIEHPELKDRVRGGRAERGLSPSQLGGKIGVGYLIDRCGLKGKKIGGAQIWESHANYIVNLGNAKTKNVLALISLVKNSVKEKYSVELEEEIRRMK